MKTLDELSASKLQPEEQQRIRDAADTLLFCDDSTATEARAAHDDVEALTRHLSGSGRWTDERAQQLVHDIDACGPFVTAAL
jgi:guanyl-specific ribonuclease Sa